MSRRKKSDDMQLMISHREMLRTQLSTLRSSNLYGYNHPLLNIMDTLARMNDDELIWLRTDLPDQKHLDDLAE